MVYTITPIELDLWHAGVLVWKPSLDVEGECNPSQTFSLGSFDIFQNSPQLLHGISTSTSWGVGGLPWGGACSLCCIPGVNGSTAIEQTRSTTIKTLDCCTSLQAVGRATQIPWVSTLVATASPQHLLQGWPCSNVGCQDSKSS